MTEDDMVGWHHRLSGHEFEQTPGDSERQGSLVCCSPWGHKESDMTQRLNNNCTPQDLVFLLKQVQEASLKAGPYEDATGILICDVENLMSTSHAVCFCGLLTVVTENHQVVYLL